MIGDASTAERIGAAWLRSALAPVSDFGRRAEERAAPFGPGDAIVLRARCAQILALAEQLAPDGVAHVRAALRRAPDPLDIVSRANLGDPLTDVDFFELGRFADAVDEAARAWDAAGGSSDDRPPTVGEVVEVLAAGRAGGLGFYLDDGYAAPLGDARRAFARADAALGEHRARLARALEPLLGGAPDADEFILMRDALPALPAGVRVVRETPAYWLVALELDAPALAAVAQRDAASARVGACEDEARRELATRIAAAGPAVVEAVAALGELDRTLARVAFTQRWGGCVPAVAERGIAFTHGSFVPLRAAREDAGLSYTPISLDLRGVAVLTGPNMGGKSVALATCGFLALCAASGVPPPAQAAAIALFEHVAWIGSDQRADRDRFLSAFGAEVVRARDVLAAQAGPTLVLVDEFARTTGPREGRALLVALIESFARRDIDALVATHFDGVAREAGAAHFAIAGLSDRAFAGHAVPTGDVHAALDVLARAMDYRIVPVTRESDSPSDALAVAALLGLDPPLVERASALFARDAAGPLAEMAE